MAWSDCSVSLPISIPESPAGYAVGAVVAVSLDTSHFAAAGWMRADRRDLFVTWGASEIHRVLTDTETVMFRVQEAVAPGVAPTGYTLHLGHLDEAGAPLSDPRQVWPAYVDGADIAALTTTGSVTAMSMPRPQFLKRPRPVFAHVPPEPWGVRDVWGCVFDGSLYHAWCSYQGGQGWMTSPDLYNWTNRTGTYPAYPANPPTPPRAVAAISPQFQMPNGKWFALTVGSGPNGFAEDIWISRGMTADSLTGPWTLISGDLVPLGAEGAVDDSTTSAGSIGTVDGGATYLLFHGIMQGGVNRGVGLATTTDLTDASKYVKTRVSVLDGASEQIENCAWMHDPVRGMYYILACHIGRNDTNADEKICAQHLYWSTDPLNWDLNNKTSILETEWGTWHDTVLGLPSHPVVKDGVLFNWFDGSDLTRFSNPTYGANWGHSAGLSEAPFPFAWGSAVQMAAGATLETPAAALVGDGIVRAKVRFRTGSLSGSRFGLRDGSNSYYVMPPATSEYGDNTDKLRFSVDGAAAQNGHVIRVTNQLKTVEFRRTGGTLAIIYSGFKVWEGAATTAPLKVYAQGDMVIEEVTVVPAAATGSVVEPDLTAFPVVATPVAAHADATATARITVPLSGVADGQAGGSGAMAPHLPLSGAVAGRADAAGQLAGSSPLAGDAAAHADAAAGLTVGTDRLVLLSSTDGSTTSSTVPVLIVSSSDGTAVGIAVTPSGWYGDTPATMSADPAKGVAAAQAVLAMRRAASGDTGGTGGASGTLVQRRPLTGQGGGYSDVAATLMRVRLLSGLAGGVASVFGNLGGGGAALEAWLASAGSAEAAGTLAARQLLAGLASGLGGAVPPPPRTPRSAAIQPPRNARAGMRGAPLLPRPPAADLMAMALAEAQAYADALTLVTPPIFGGRHLAPPSNTRGKAWRPQRLQ